MSKEMIIAQKQGFPKDWVLSLFLKGSMQDSLLESYTMISLVTKFEKL